MSADKRPLCSCGFPQSHPIPHEHEQEVEVNMSEHDKLESQARDVKALNKVLGDYSAGYIVRACGSYKDLLDLYVLSLGALVAIFVPEGTKVGEFVKIEQPYANLIKSLEAAIRKR